MNKFKLFSTFVAFLLVCSCNNKSRIDGLWTVKLVKVGDQEVTPNARWTRFNSDSTQESGNGWFQHSIGTWNYNNKTDKLMIHNVNGLKDSFGSYAVSYENDLMYWRRIEEGMKVEVILEKSEHLPQTYGDKLLGLWKLEEISGDGKYFKESDNRKKSGYLFLRWDKRFVLGTEKGRINGFYNVNGHRPELEIIPYGEKINREFWKVNFEENRIKLKLLNSDKLVERKFVRVNEFPN
jgi:hypothetical protein